jgi:hypothetical protein
MIPGSCFQLPFRSIGCFLEKKCLRILSSLYLGRVKTYDRQLLSTISLPFYTFFG